MLTLTVCLSVIKLRNPFTHQTGFIVQISEIAKIRTHKLILRLCDENGQQKYHKLRNLNGNFVE